MLKTSTGFRKFWLIISAEVIRGSGVFDRNMEAQLPVGETIIKLDLVITVVASIW